jgi:DNA-directed RNA polymerase subunit H (RpoH/RPB5)
MLGKRRKRLAVLSHRSLRFRFQALEERRVKLVERFGIVNGSLPRFHHADPHQLGVVGVG